MQAFSLGVRMFLLAKMHVETPEERRKWDESKEVGEGVEREKRKHFCPLPSPFPCFALAPALRVATFTLPNLP